MQKTKPAPTSLWLLSFLLLFLFTPSPIHAQTTSLSIWPPLLQATIQPGKSITQVYRLKNLGDDTTITTTIVPFAPADEFGHVKLYGSELAPPFFSFQNADIDTFPTTIPLKAGQTKELVLKIRIPENQPEADHYLTFLFKSNTIGLIGGTGTTNQATIGSNILLTISKTGQPIKTAKIEEFKALQGDTLLNLLDSFSPTSFLLRIKNTGKTRFKVVGQVEIYNTFKKKVAILPLREDNILADSTRQIITDPNTPKWSPIFPFGLYSATATITPQDSTNTISTTITFLILPYKALLIILLLLLLKPIYTKFKSKNLPITNQ